MQRPAGRQARRGQQLLRPLPGAAAQHQGQLLCQRDPGRRQRPPAALELPHRGQRRQLQGAAGSRQRPVRRHLAPRKLLLRRADAARQQLQQLLRQRRRLAAQQRRHAAPAGDAPQVQQHLQRRRRARRRRRRRPCCLAAARLAALRPLQQLQRQPAPQPARAAAAGGLQVARQLADLGQELQQRHAILQLPAALRLALRQVLQGQADQHEAVPRQPLAAQGAPAPGPQQRAQAPGSQRAQLGAAQQLQQGRRGVRRQHLWHDRAQLLQPLQRGVENARVVAPDKACD
jgi:hypothetical protein